MLYHKIRKKNNTFFFGHRGAPNIAPENSIISLSKSIELGSDGVEVDIQITKDYKIILFHDNFILSSSNKKHFIHKTKYEKIVQLCIENNIPKPDLFDSLIPLIINNPMTVFNLEIKSLSLNNSKILSYILNNIDQEILYNQCIISSFNYFLLYQLRFLLLYKGSIALILGPNHIQGRISLIINKVLIIFLKPNFLHVSIDNYSQLPIGWIQNQSILINVYTINDNIQLKKYIALGADGIFTDNHFLYNK